MDGKLIFDNRGPSMADVPIGEPRSDYRPSTIGQGLLDLAAWFDIYDDRCGYTGDRGVQRDLRSWAARTRHMPADISLSNSAGEVIDIKEIE